MWNTKGNESRRMRQELKPEEEDPDRPTHAHVLFAGAVCKTGL